jgi:hypothetical protein
MKNNQKGFSPVIVLVTLAVIAGIIFAGLKVINQSDDTSDTNESSNSKTVDQQETLKNQDVSVGFNEKVELSNGVAITVSGIEPNWQATKEGRDTPTAADGTSHVAVNITVVNMTEEAFRFGGTDFTLFDSSGNDYIETYTNYQADDEVITLGEIPARGSRTGQIIYRNVPNGADLSFVYEEDYKNSGTGEEVTVKATFK